MMLSSLVQGGVAAILPAVAELDTRNKTQQVRDVWILAQKFSLVILIPAIAFLIIMGGEFLRLWVGDELAELKSILVILAVGHFLRLTQHASFRVLAGRGKHKVFSRLTIVMAIAVIVLAVIVAKYTQAGLVGIAFSNTIPMVIISGFVLSLYANKQMNTSLADNLKHVWLPAFLACFPTLVLLGVWQYLFPPDCWTHIIAVILVALVMTAVSVWFLGLTKIEKSRILAIVGKSTQGSV
jgi:O-antigen/teichoic acid export membrane protein